jgi:SMI1-KNR4 cell-wall
VTLQRLRQVAAPPPAPSGTGTPEEWAAAERALGLELPGDYKELVRTYGSGKFANFIFVYTPFTSNPYSNLLEQRGLNLAAYKTMRAQAPRTAPYPAYPEPGGVLPRAHTENGDVLYWLTEGPPDQWPIIVIETRHGSLQQYDLTTTEFLAQALEGRLGPDIFPSAQELVGAAPYINLTGQ